MNAYELADCLEALCKENKGSFTKDAVNMLRQQADRIAELEKQLTFQPNQTLACPSHLSGLTPQIKPLSNEEIKEIANKYLYVLNDVPYADDIKQFARAIEERHGIK